PSFISQPVLRLLCELHSFPTRRSSDLVLGRGETVGQELAGNPKVAMVSMTGSVSAGEKIMATAAKNITKVCLELGGKAPAIVMEDRKSTRLKSSHVSDSYAVFCMKKKE